MAPPGKEQRPGRQTEALSNRVAAVVPTIARGSDTRRQRRRLKVVIESPHCAYVTGYGSRDLLTELRGRPPVWATLTRAWNTTERTARDLIAIAESRGYEVDVETYVVMTVER